MKRLIPYILITAIAVGFLTTASATTTYHYVVRELSQSFTALQTFTAGMVSPAANNVSVNSETLLVAPGESATITAHTGFNHAWLKSVAVYSGCDSYSFALYPDSGFNSGEELLVVVGQVLNYYDGAPPVLIDSDGAGDIYAKFTNNGVYGCTFTLLANGVGF